MTQKPVRCPSCSKRATAPYTRHLLRSGRWVLSFRCGCGRKWKAFTRDAITPPADQTRPAP